MDCEVIVKNGWQMNTRLELKELIDGIENCDSMMSKWNREVFRNLNINIGMKQKELDELMSSPNLDARAIETCRKELIKLMHMEEIMWKQRAKNHYIKKRDRNTRYFHMTTSRKKCNNFIFRINDELGS